MWLAFACLIAGITITFYLPRRRVWTRLTPDGRLGIVWRSDRYVDVEREFGGLLDDLVAARDRAEPGSPQAGVVHDAQRPTQRCATDTEPQPDPLVPWTVTGTRLVAARDGPCAARHRPRRQAPTGDP